MVYIIRLIVLPVKTFLEFFLLMREILICRIAYLPRIVNIIREVKILELQPAVITTFALSDLMALSDDLY